MHCARVSFFLSRSILEVIYNKIAIKIFSLVYFHFEKLQSNTLKLMKWFPRYRRLENELNIGCQHKCEGPGATPTISLASFACDFVFLQHGRQNLCFLNLKRLITNHLHLFIQVRSTFALRKCLYSLRHWSISVLFELSYSDSFWFK